MEVPVTKFRAELRQWLERAQAGEEIIVTDHGTPIARVIGAERLTLMEQLIRDGLVTPGKPGPRIDARKIKRIRPREPVSPLVSELRD
jgi:prevent-host-death family protein